MAIGRDLGAVVVSKMEVGGELGATLMDDLVRSGMQGVPVLPVAFDENGFIDPGVGADPGLGHEVDREQEDGQAKQGSELRFHRA